MGKKILSIILSLAIIFGSFPAGIFATKAYAAEATYKVEIVSFARGAQADLRSSELLEARLFVSEDNGNNWKATDNYNGTPITQLNYTWTNELSTYLYVYNAHNMYGINNTAGEQEIGTGRWSNSFTGTGFAWAAIYGANIDQTDLVGTISVVVKDKSGKEIGRDEHEGYREQTGGSSYRPTYTYYGILMPNLTEDIKASAFGLFEGDTKNVLDMLGEAGIVHITCTACSVSGVEAVPKNNNEYISVSGGNVTAKKPGEKTKDGDTQITFTVTKKNCKFHQNSSGNGNIKVYIYKKPKTTTTATTLTLTNLDKRCTYYIDGVQGRLVEVGDDDDITNDYIIFEGLTPNTDYTVMAKGETSDTEPVYAYVYDRTKQSLTGTIRVLKHTNSNTSGALTDINTMYPNGKIVFRLDGDLANIETTKNGTGVYSAILSTGTFYPWYTLDGNQYIQGGQQLIVTDRNVESTIHFYEVEYNLNGGTLENPISNSTHISGEKVIVSAQAPKRKGFTFDGWKDQYGNHYKAGDVLTNAIAKPYLLEAVWKDAVNIYLNVEINHEGGGGYDTSETKDEIRLRLLSATAEGAPLLQTGDEITISSKVDGHPNHVYSYEMGKDGTEHEDIIKTFYTAGTTATFEDMPDAIYSIVTDKEGYEVESLTSTKDSNGDWTINVKMKYAPQNQNLKFSVKVADSVPDNLVPQAAIVKVVVWDNGKWRIITQQEGSNPGTRVNFNGRSGEGSYPVWTYENEQNKNPYYYRIVVTSLVYPDGNIVPVKNDVLQNLTGNATDLYTIEIGVGKFGKPPIAGLLEGAYFKEEIGGTISQQGTLDAVITATRYNVTFDAQGGKVNGFDKQVVQNQYKVPDLENYVPTREGGYIFRGWYKEPECKTLAIPGEYLTNENTKDRELTLYAKWSEPLKISGNITVNGSYILDGNTHIIHDADRAKNVLVVLQKLENGEVINIASQQVKITYQDNLGKGTYLFEGIEDNNDDYRVVAYSVNFDSLYRNEPETDTYSENIADYNHTDHNAVFGSDKEAKIDAYLTFNPHSFPLKYEVDATAIGNGYRPTSTEMLVLYDDGLKGQNPLHWAIISQMIQGEEIIGQDTVLTEGFGSNSYSVWSQKTDGTGYYNYAIKLDKYTPYNGGETAFTDTEEPFTVEYNGYAYYDELKGQSHMLKAILAPKEYKITFALGFTETDSDHIGESMDAYLKADGSYSTMHKWSFDTNINAAPKRDGYEFKGWFIDANNNETRDENEVIVTKVDASVHNEVTLTAEWEKLPDIYVDVVIIHKEKSGTGYNNDSDKHNITFTVDQKNAGLGGDFTEVFRKTINWDGSSAFNIDGYEAAYDGSGKTTYIANKPTLKATGKDMLYTATAAKRGYEVDSENTKTITDANGNLRLTLTLYYDPNNFDFTYSVELDKSFEGLPAEVKPKAVNVKVTSWYNTPYDEDFGDAAGTDTTAWYTITQHRNTYQRVELNADGKGTASYPVWMHASKGDNPTPYYYRIEVVSYELADGTILNVNNLQNNLQDNQPSVSPEYTTEGDIYKAVIHTDEACLDPDTLDTNTLKGAYYDATKNSQIGAVKAVISIKTHTVTLDPEGGIFNDGTTADKVLGNLVQMPDISAHTPTKAGYTFAGWEWGNNVEPLSKGDVLTKDVVLKAKWTPVVYNIKYVVNGGKLPDGVSDTKTYTVTDSVVHPVPTRENYKFVGWYDNEALNGNPEVSFSAGQTGDKVYYAKWESDIVSLTIHKTFKSGTKVDPNQLFIFHIENKNKGIDLKVTVKGAGAVTINDLPRDKDYTVTEEVKWSWRYTPDANSKTVDLSQSSNTVTFINEQTSNKWINAFSKILNRFR